MSDVKKILDEAAKHSEGLSHPNLSVFEQLSKQARLPRFDLPRNLGALPRLDPIHIPSAKEANGYQSAGILVRTLANTVAQWRRQVPADSQPIVRALLQGGVQIDVSLLAEESFHGLRIEGTIDGSPCMLLTHQSSVQLLCFVAKVEDESKRRHIGFIIDGEQSEA